MEYYVGEWHGHKIQVENAPAEKRVLFDGLIAAESGAGVRLGTSFDFELPDYDGLHCHVLLDGAAAWSEPVCYCVIGRPLETEYNKKTKTHTAFSDGHKIEAVNKFSSVLLIDGKEADRSPKGLHFSGICSGAPDETGRCIIAVFDGVSEFVLSPKCLLYADAENVPMSRYARNGSDLTTVEDKKFFLNFG